MEIVPKALEFATAHQKELFLKGTKVPFMTHSLNVCRLLAERDCADELLAAALLHDIVEVTPVTIEEVKATFGINMFRTIRMMTEPFKRQKAHEAYDERLTWVFRKAYSMSLVENRDTPVNVLLLILAEKTDNIASLSRDLERYGEVVWRRYNAGRAIQKWFYESLLTACMGRKDVRNEAFRDLLGIYKSHFHKVFTTSNGT